MREKYKLEKNKLEIFEIHNNMYLHIICNICNPYDFLWNYYHNK